MFGGFGELIKFAKLSPNYYEITRPFINCGKFAKLLSAKMFAGEPDSPNFSRLRYSLLTREIWTTPHS